MVERPEYLSDEVDLIRQNIDELENTRQAMIQFNDANPRNADLPPVELIRLEDERGKMTQSMLSNISCLSRMDIGDIAEVCVDPMKYYAWLKDVKEFVINQMRDELISRDNIVSKAVNPPTPEPDNEPDPFVEKLRSSKRTGLESIFQGVMIVLGILIVMGFVTIASLINN